MMQYGKSLPATMVRIVSELATYGFTGYTVNGNGNILGHSITEMWIDEAPDVRAIGRVQEPKLNFTALSLRTHFGIESHLTNETNGLFCYTSLE